MFGVNPILACALSHIVEVVIYLWWTVPFGGGRVGIEFRFTETVFSPWLPEKMASLAFALLFVACIYAVLRIFHQRGIILRV